MRVFSRQTHVNDTWKWLRVKGVVRKDMARSQSSRAVGGSVTATCCTPRSALLLLSLAVAQLASRDETTSAVKHFHIVERTRLFFISFLLSTTGLSVSIWGSKNILISRRPPIFLHTPNINVNTLFFFFQSLVTRIWFTHVTVAGDFREL